MSDSIECSKRIKLENENESETEQKSFNMISSMKQQRQNQNSIFVVPAVSTFTTVSLTNDHGSTPSPPHPPFVVSADRNQPKGAITTPSPTTTNTKITLVPLSTNVSVNAHAGVVNKITPVKIVNNSNNNEPFGSPSKMSFLSTIPKKLVQISGANGPTNYSTTTSSLPTTTIVRTQSGTVATAVETTLSSPKKIFTITSSNGNSIPSSAFSNSVNSSDKIQYVKIVNSSNSTINQQQHTTASGSSGGSIPNTSIKITTVNSSTQEGTNTIRPIPSFLTAIAPNSVKTIHQSQNQSQSIQRTIPTTTTVNTINKTTTPLIQKLQSVSTPTSTFTTLSSSPPTATATNTSTVTANNYKVLTQQLPQPSNPQSAQANIITIKSLNNNLAATSTANTTTLTSTANNRILITKTISSNSTNNINNNNSNSNSNSSNNNNNDENKKHFLNSVITANKSENTSNTNSGSTNFTTAVVNIKPGMGQTTPICLTPIANSSNANAIGKVKTNSFFNESEKSLSTLTATNPQSIKQQLTANPRPNNNLLSLNHVFSSSNSNSNSSLNSNLPSHQSHQSHSNSVNNVNNSMMTVSSSTSSSNSSANVRKPCNCTKSMCLKLYCDCFAMGSFCHDCNCINCFNTLEHEDERNKAIKLVLDRNPQAFQSKIGKFTAQIALNKILPISNTNISSSIENIETTTSLKRPATDDLDEIHSRHVKGCNCKKSNCLKRYCECYLAKIQCSALCKCVGCKNCDESTRTLLQLANAADLRKQQQQNSSNPNSQQSNQQRILSNHSNPPFSSLNLSNQSNYKSSLLNNGGSDFRKLGLVNNLNFLSNKEVEKQLNIYRSYSSTLNSSIESSCLRLINRAQTELVKLNETKMDNDGEVMDLQNEPDHDEAIQKCIIEEFGACLAEIISNAEKRRKLN